MGAVESKVAERVTERNSGRKTGSCPGSVMVGFGSGGGYHFAAKLPLLGDNAGFFLVLMALGIAGLLALDVYPPLDRMLLWATPMGTAAIVLGGVWFSRKLQYDQPSLVWYMALVIALLLAGIGWVAFLMQALEVTEPVRQTAALVLLVVELLLGALLFAVDVAAVGVYLLGIALASFVHLSTSGPQLSSHLLWLLSASVIMVSLLVFWGHRYQCLLVHSLAHLDELRPEYKAAREEVEQLKRRLEAQENYQHEVKRELHVAKDAAEAVSVAKTEFLATMSHEIRTPLNGIVPILEILRETSLDPEQAEFVSTALNSSHHLMNLINDILDYSKIEAGKLELESIELDIPELLDSVISLMAKSAERRHTRLHSKIAENVPLQVRGDPFRLRQILTNLVGNAIKFTEQGNVSVEVKRHASSAKEVALLFLVRDTGIGISKEALGRLFRMFSQADATTTRKHGGSGLGLVICKRLVEMMGGRIGVRSDRGKGSVFWFAVPMRKTRHEVPLAHKSRVRGRVLLAGFDELERQRIVGYLNEWEMLNERATTSLDVLNKLKASARLGASWSYDVLLLDAQTMGSEVAGLKYGIDKISELPNLEILAVDGFPSMGSMLKDQGVMEVIPRPVQEHDLRSKLYRLLDIGATEKPVPEQPAALYGVMPDAAFSWEDGHREERLAPDLTETAQKPSPNRDVAAELPLEGRVMVVEDNPVNLSVMRKLLQRLGIEGEVARDGLEAVEATKKAQYDLVLMDVQMPNMDGLEATRLIRRREQEKGLARVAIVAMTANAMSGDRENCLDSGMDDYMAKPIKPAGLKSMLRRWLPLRPVQPVEGTKPGNEVMAELVLRQSPAPQVDVGQQPGGTQVPEQEILDREVLLELFEVMEEEALALLREYLDNAPELLKAIDLAVGEGNAEALVLPAHSLKSSSANVGAIQVSALAKRLEFMGRENNMGEAPACWRTMQAACCQAKESLEYIIQRGGI